MLKRISFIAGLASGVLVWEQIKPTFDTSLFQKMPRPLGRALITGASAGIGAAYAHRLAAQGYDLTLVARREERLRHLAETLEARHAISCNVYPADLAQPATVESLATHIREMSDLTLLINNAGFGTSGQLADIELQKQLDMIHLHINATVSLTHAALPQMLERQKGAIINVSSIAAFFHGAESVNYCATKAFLNSFSISLQEEVKEKGILIQALCPGFTYSEFHDTPEYRHFKREDIPSPLWMTAKEVVEESLAALSTKQVIVIPGARNRWIVTTRTSMMAPVIEFARKHVLA